MQAASPAPLNAPVPARLMSLRQASASPDAVEAAAEELLRLPRPRAFTSGTPVALTVAEAFAARRAQLDRIPALLREAVSELKSGATLPTSDLYSRGATGSPFTRPEWHAWQLVADLATRVNERELAHTALEALTRGIVNKIAHGPISELRSQAGKPDGVHVIAAIRKAFHLQD